MPKLQLGFHRTFALKKPDLLKLLSVGNTDIGLNDSLKTLMNKTGLGTNKLPAMKSWAVRAGLIDEDNLLTPECRIILEKDHYLESNVTDWFIHFNLSFGHYSPLQRTPDFPSQFGGWSYFVYTFLPKYQEFTLDDLVEKSSEIFTQDSLNSIKKNFRILIRAYSEKEGIAGCKLIQKKNNNIYGVIVPDISQPFMIYIIGYVLAILWKRDFAKKSSILLDEILHQKMGILPVFAIDETQKTKVLDGLESNQIIQKRTAQPHLIGTKPKSDNTNKNIQVIKCWSNPLDLLIKAYEHDYSMPNQPLINVLDPLLSDDDEVFPFLECQILTPRFNHSYVAS